MQVQIPVTRLHLPLEWYTWERYESPNPIYGLNNTSNVLFQKDGFDIK